GEVHMKKMFLFAAAALAVWPVIAQPTEHVERDVVVVRGGATAGQRVMGPGPGAPMVDFSFVSSEFSWDGKTVKNSPYSADAVTETTQTLADGNRISRKSASQIFRDSEGRTRREQSFDMVGPWASGKSHKTIFINDPVSNVNWVLEPETKTARKMPMMRGPMPGGAVAVGAVGAAGPHFEMIGDVPGPGHNVMFERRIEGPLEARTQNFKNEQLGKQMIEGVQ